VRQAAYKNEADVKKEVKKIIKDHWYFMPPANGYGRSGIPDFLGCAHRCTFAVETKFGNNKPTANQEREIANIRTAGGKVWVVNNKNIEDFALEFEAWVATLCL